MLLQRLLCSIQCISIIFNFDYELNLIHHLNKHFFYYQIHNNSLILCSFNLFNFLTTLIFIILSFTFRSWNVNPKINSAITIFSLKANLLIPIILNLALLFILTILFFIPELHLLKKSIIIIIKNNFKI